SHRTNIALGHAASMGCHLRFGFEATCGRDTVALRDDNTADYPWLCFALATLMSEYSRTGETGARGVQPGVEARLKDSPSRHVHGVDGHALVDRTLTGPMPAAKTLR